MNLDSIKETEILCKKVLFDLAAIQNECPNDMHLSYKRKLTGNLRRSSMDLTRQLSELRK